MHRCAALHLGGVYSYCPNQSVWILSYKPELDGNSSCLRRDGICLESRSSVAEALSSGMMNVLNQQGWDAIKFIYLYIYLYIFFVFLASLFVALLARQL